MLLDVNSILLVPAIKLFGLAPYFAEFLVDKMSHVGHRLVKVLLLGVEFLLISSEVIDLFQLLIHILNFFLLVPLLISDLRHLSVDLLLLLLQIRDLSVQWLDQEGNTVTH